MGCPHFSKDAKITSYFHYSFSDTSYNQFPSIKYAKVQCNHQKNVYIWKSIYYSFLNKSLKICAVTMRNIAIFRTPFISTASLESRSTMSHTLCIHHQWRILRWGKLLGKIDHVDAANTTIFKQVKNIVNFFLTLGWFRLREKFTHQKVLYFAVYALSWFKKKCNIVIHIYFRILWLVTSFTI